MLQIIRVRGREEDGSSKHRGRGGEKECDEAQPEAKRDSAENRESATRDNKVSGKAWMNWGQCCGSTSNAKMMAK